MAPDVLRLVAAADVVYHDSVADGPDSLGYLFLLLSRAGDDFADPFLLGDIGGLFHGGRDEIASELSRNQSQKDYAAVHAVDRLLLPAVERGVIQESGDRRMFLVARKRVVELRSLRDPVHEFRTEGDGGSQPVGLGKDLLSHALQLRPGEVPLVGHVLLRQIFLDGLEDPDIEAVVLHLNHVVLRHCKLVRGDEVDLDGLPERQSVDLAVHGASVVQVADKGDVKIRGVPAVVLEEGELVQQFLCGMLVLSVSGVDEGRGVGQAVAPCVGRAFLSEVAADALDLAADDEDAVVVAAEGVEGVGVAFALVERGVLGVHLGELDVVEVG